HRNSCSIAPFLLIFDSFLIHLPLSGETYNHHPSFATSLPFLPNNHIDPTNLAQSQTAQLPSIATSHPSCRPQQPCIRAQTSREGAAAESTLRVPSAGTAQYVRWTRAPQIPLTTNACPDVQLPKTLSHICLRATTQLPKAVRSRAPTRNGAGRVGHQG